MGGRKDTHLILPLATSPGLASRLPLQRPGLRPLGSRPAAPPGGGRRVRRAIGGFRGGHRAREQPRRRPGGRPRAAAQPEHCAGPGGRTGGGVRKGPVGNGESLLCARPSPLPPPHTCTPHSHPASLSFLSPLSSLSQSPPSRFPSPSRRCSSPSGPLSRSGTWSGSGATLGRPTARPTYAAETPGRRRRSWQTPQRWSLRPAGSSSGGC
jgi:hypothetical protein